MKRNLTIRQLRSNLSPLERNLWKHLRQRQIKGVKFRRQHQIGRYIVDFICLEKRLIIEADGGQHAEFRKRDYQRDEWLKNKGYKVLRFWNNEISGNIEGVLRKIESALAHPTLTLPFSATKKAPACQLSGRDPSTKFGGEKTRGGTHNAQHIQQGEENFFPL